MQRFALEHLKVWRDRHNRKPLVVRGARQVGKSYLVHLLAEQCFERMLEIDLELEPDSASLFASKDPAIIVPLLEARYGVPVVPGETLLFIDEVQVAAEILASLRYFHERMPGLHVIAAGSLLDFALTDHTFSMPVGRIEYLHLGPMSLEEFLLALDRGSLLSFLREFSMGEDLPVAIHSELLRLFRQYLVVGGMPASVAAFVGGGGFRESEAERQAILSTFREDFAKYAKRVPWRRLEKVFARIPALTGSRFKYSRIDREERSRDLSRALELLCLARVAYRVRHCAANGIPLGAEADDRAFKVLFMDVGLLCRSMGLNLLDVEQPDDVMLVNAGAVCEQFVGQHLLHAGEAYAEPELYCWMRQKRNSSAEVDYVTTVGGQVVPVEVKAGKSGTLKSLHVFLRDKEQDFGLRFNSDVPSMLRTVTNVAGGENRSFRLLSLPLYLVGQHKRLCQAVLRH